MDGAIIEEPKGIGKVVERMYWTEGSDTSGDKLVIEFTDGITVTIQTSEWISDVTWSMTGDK